jgi:hypothetical protein
MYEPERYLVTINTADTGLLDHQHTVQHGTWLACVQQSPKTRIAACWLKHEACAGAYVGELQLV